ncbi:hypothetical protein GCM10010971_38570 [Silvimonas amylolytica]|uniref:Secreted protein n=1 Tax=Silvimonas amylolytica TaxID=449663 RepID=A0ABQ2PRW1_9NEIS|nr:hypothetical protein GCM10010971_38570 [Silvimonas amylolytica]
MNSERLLVGAGFAMATELCVNSVALGVDVGVGVGVEVGVGAGVGVVVGEGAGVGVVLGCVVDAGCVERFTASKPLSLPPPHAPRVSAATRIEMWIVVRRNCA